MKKIVVIHTSLVSIETLKDLFFKLIPEAEIYNIVDDSLLAEVMKKGKVSHAIIERMKNHVASAEILGADVILSQCSSMGPAIDFIANSCKTPIIKIDQAMAEKAVSMGSKIGVVATVRSTMKPSCDLINSVAKREKKEIEITEGIVDGALAILLKEGNQKRHNELVLEKIRLLEESCDVIVLAQGSMIVLLPELKDFKTPILTSPELGVRQIRKVLELDD
jgi:Asp/Glu/hydantoin racemase